MALFDIIAAIIFVLTSTILFNGRFRENRFLVLCAGAVALVSTYYLTRQLVDQLISERLPRQTSGPSSQPPSIPQFDATAIWAPSPDLDLYHYYGNNCHSNGISTGDCLVEAMKANGASPAAIEFSKQYERIGTLAGDSAYGYMSAFHELGAIDAATVVHPFLMDEQEQVVLVNGDPPIMTLVGSDWDDVLKSINFHSNPEFQKIFVQYPRAELWKVKGVVSSEMTRDGGESILVIWDIRNGCRACGEVGTARIWYTFDRQRRFKSAKLFTVARSP